MRKEGEASIEYEVVNQAKALWTLPRTEIKDEEYREFYQYLAHDFTDPLAWSHNRVEGKREYTSLLYIPGRAPFDLWQRDAARGLKLYVRRVFIMDDAEQLLPLYLRFVKGVLDSRRPAAQRLARAAAAGPGGRGHPRRPHQARARPARAPGQGRAGEVRHLLEGVRRGAEGRGGAGCGQPGGDPRAAALCQHPRPRRHPRGEPGGVHRAHEAAARNASIT